MKALSIKQPWAWLICAGYKDIENRNWKIGRNPRHGMYSSYDVHDFSIDLPSRIYVHAGKRHDMTQDTADFLSNIGFIIYPDQWDKLSFGAIIGEVDITDCVTESNSPWFVGKYGFMLANPVLYDNPIPCRGMLGFFEPDVEVIK